MKTKRIIALLLAALLLGSTITACGGTTEETAPAGETVATETTAAEETVEETEAFPPLEEKNFGGKDVNMFLRTEWEYEFVVEEETGANVSDAIFRRNMAVEEKHGVNLNFIDQAGAWGSHTAFTNTIHNSVLAGDGAYDMIAGYQAVLTLNIVNEDLLNLYDVPHIVLNAPWWTQEGVEALTYNGKCFMAGGDIAVSLLEGIFCMFFNKQLALDYAAPDLYELARNGEWTHDKLAEVTKGVYQDLNGDGKKGIEDLFGLCTGGNPVRNTVVCYDTPTISAEGKVVWMTEHTVNVVEKLVTYFNENDAFLCRTVADVDNIFRESRSLLVSTTLGTSAVMRDMEDDFGIIPMPKFDVSQEKYMTSTINEVSMMCVPVTASDKDMSGYILEAMCRESTDTVADAFYNVALQGKYARDEQSLEMIGLIRDSLTFDFGWIASLATDVSGAQYQVMVEENNPAFATWYAEKENVILTKVQDYLALYE